MYLRRSRGFGDYAALFFHYKWRAVLGFCLVLGLAAAWLIFGAKTYESEAKIFVRVGRENAGLDPTVRPGEAISLLATREEEINSIVDHLKSRAILEHVYDTVYPKPDTDVDRERALRTLRENIEVTSPRASTVINVRVKDTTPERAQATAKAMVEHYLDEHMRIHRPAGSYDFFAEQTELLGQRLETVQVALRETKDEAGIGSVEGRRAALESQVSAIETQIQSVQASLTATAAKMSALRKAVATLPAPLIRQLMGGAPADGLGEMEAQLFALRVEQQKELATLTPKHPKVNALKEQVEKVEQALIDQQPEQPQMIDAVLSELMAEHASLEAMREKLSEQLAAATNELTELNATEVVVRQYERQIEQLEGDYLAYAEKKEQSRIDAQLQTDRISNLSIIQPATFVPDRISPRPAQTLLLGGVLGCLGACVVVLVSDRFGPSTRGAQQLPDELDVPRPARSRERPPRQMELLHAGSGNGHEAEIG